LSAVALVHTMRIQSLRYVAHFIAVVLQVTYLYSYIKTLQLSTRSWLLSASFLSWGLFRKRNKRRREWGKGGKHFCMQLVARYFRVRDEWLFFIYIYKRWKHLVGGEDEEHSHTHSDTQSLTSSNGGSFSIRNKHKLLRWILSTLRGANVVSLGKNLHWNLVIWKEPEWYIETGS
jgi:hypothetical protein